MSQGYYWELKVQTRKGFDPQQPRVPAGSSSGGRWASNTGISPVEDLLREFSSREDADAWGKEAYKEWAESLTPEERDALEYYMTDGFLPINMGMRHDGYLSEKDSEARSLIDNALSRTSLSASITVHRGICSSPECMSEYGWMEPGETFVDEGFSSTALTPRQAFRAKVMAEIIIPKGSKGAYIGGLSPLPEQVEFLLPRDTVFEILSREENQWGGFNLVIRVVE